MSPCACLSLFSSNDKLTTKSSPNVIVVIIIITYGEGIFSNLAMTFQEQQRRQGSFRR